MNNLIEYYIEYDEETRLSRSKARQIEYLTTLKFMDSTFPKSGEILDVASGTGIYAFDLAKQGFSVTALDITPRYIEIINDKLKHHNDIDLSTGVCNAMDLSQFPDNKFDCVLCMGPLYHLQTVEEREKCMKECLRVLKTGGLLLMAYINKTYLAPNMLITDKDISTTNFNELLEKGLIKNYPSSHFLSVGYFSSPEEMEDLAKGYNLEILHHIGVDGMVGFIDESINQLSENDFEKWLQYHYSTCQIPSLLGISNHGLIIAKK